MDTKQHLEVVGPLSRGDSFHVHDASCADLRQSKYNGYRDQRGQRWTGDYASEQKVIEDIYSDFIGDDGTTWADYASDVRIFPCVHLPRETA
jgi:hypothetical protein